MTLTDTQHPMKSLSAIIVDSTNTTSEYVTSSTAVVLELPGHLMHQQDAPLIVWVSGDFRGVWIECKPAATVIKSLYRIHLREKSTRM
jgi:hypothetical protein